MQKKEGPAACDKSSVSGAGAKRDFVVSLSDVTIMTMLGSSIKRTFTLIELLVAIGIIAVLASLIGPSLGKGQKASLQSACMSNLKSVGTEVSRLYFDAVFPSPLDPFAVNGNLVVQRSFFQPRQMIPVHYPFDIPGPDFPEEDDTGDVGGTGEIGGDVGTGGGGTGSGEGGTGGGSGGSGSGSSGGSPSLTGGTERISAVEVLTLFMNGCPEVEVNPLSEVGESAPEYRSYSFLGSNAAKNYRQAWPWLISESFFSSIGSIDHLALERHDGKVNVYFKDGHVEALSPEELEFPEAQP